MNIWVKQLILSLLNIVYELWWESSWHQLTVFSHGEFQPPCHSMFSLEIPWTKTTFRSVKILQRYIFKFFKKNIFYFKVIGASNINSADSHGRTILMAAVQSKQYKTISFLLKYRYRCTLYNWNFIPTFV